MELAVEGVRNHADVRLDRQLPERILSKAFGDRGDSIRLVDAERSRLRIGGIAANQSDVRPMERGDDSGDLLGT